MSLWRFLRQYSWLHILVKITYRTLDVVFLWFKGFSFTITLRRKPEGVITVGVEQALSLSCNSTQHVNEKPLNIDKMTVSVLFFILINIWLNVWIFINQFLHTGVYFSVWKLFKTLGKKYNIFSPKIKTEEERREKKRRGIRRMEKGKTKKKYYFIAQSQKNSASLQQGTLLKSP